MAPELRLDAIIFGGGAAGLWLLDDLVRKGCQALLLEAGRLGQGQTIAAQGIIHGGLKYTLQGLLTPSAACIREMPAIWRDCLNGKREPNLSGVRLRAEHCHLWRTDSVKSRMGMIGARFGLRVAPVSLDEANRPAVLAHCPGTVAQLDEQVIATDSFAATMAARHRDRILKIDSNHGCRLVTTAPGQVDCIELPNSHTAQAIRLRADAVILTAGGGNEALRAQADLPGGKSQRRPLHMVMLRGALPKLNGHCVDGAKTRVTITSDVDAAGRVVWQVGGQIAEDGVALDESTLIARAKAELESAIPRLDLAGVEWATYKVDRAEGLMPGGKRPEDVQVLREGNVITAWPTKLALAPRLAEEVSRLVQPQAATPEFDANAFAGWPRPEIASLPWDAAHRWFTLERGALRIEKAA